ncbi:DUF2889 domain-containing protein [Falsiroseomonas sp. CW058]|uniref:DUF2889 domain-containing protein n=1 Tax=Falsiroseomonas sp. CW058 TaxID=3388664 RepID=UPI003D31AF01
MPLSTPVEREALHRRRIDIRGYQRIDGLYDIEASLVDTKDYPFENLDRGGVIEPGEPLHGMWMRLTVDDDMVIRACEAATDFAPYSVCPEAAPNFAALAGASCGPGFNRVVKDRLGGVRGCTHLRELLAQMATVAYQTIGPMRWRRARAEREAAVARGENPPPFRRTLPLNSCHAYDEHGPVVRRFRQEAEE